MTKTVAAVLVAAVAMTSLGCGSGSPTKPAAPPPDYKGAPDVKMKMPGGEVNVESKDGKTKVEVKGEAKGTGGK